MLAPPFPPPPSPFDSDKSTSLAEKRPEPTWKHPPADNLVTADAIVRDGSAAGAAGVARPTPAARSQRSSAMTSGGAPQTYGARRDAVRAAVKSRFLLVSLSRRSSAWGEEKHGNYEGQNVTSMR